MRRGCTWWAATECMSFAKSPAGTRPADDDDARRRKEEREERERERARREIEGTTKPRACASLVCNFVVSCNVPSFFSSFLLLVIIRSLRLCSPLSLSLSLSLSPSLALIFFSLCFLFFLSFFLSFRCSFLSSFLFFLFLFFSILSFLFFFVLFFCSSRHGGAQAQGARGRALGQAAAPGHGHCPAGGPGGCAAGAARAAGAPAAAVRAGATRVSDRGWRNRQRQDHPGR